MNIYKVCNCFFLGIIILMFVSCGKPNNRESAALKRYREQGLLYENSNEFYTEFSQTNITGLGLEEGVSRRDPSGVIKVGDTYYVWYTRAEGSHAVGQDAANDSLRAYYYDLADIGYATSKDGIHWEEQGIAAKRGPKGSFDYRTIFTPDVLVANGKYYLFYQTAGELSQGLGWDFGDNLIGMSWAESPDGPWYRHPEPILTLGPKGAFDELNMHDPSLIVKGGKYYLYYKGQPKGPKLETYLEGRDASLGTRLAWGVAVADKPEGPYIKSEFNPVICAGHEIIIYPYRDGLCAMINQGPDKGSIQFSKDGIHFYPRAYGVVDVPHAAGYYRVGNFTDVETTEGQGITWGFRNRMGTVNGHRFNYLGRWDCDLSIERGNALRKNTLKHWSIPEPPKKESASAIKYQTLESLYEVDNEYYTQFKSKPVKGFNPEKGVSYNDPSVIIKVKDLYYVWYSKSIGKNKHSEIWFATSEDGNNWKEQSIVAEIKDDNSNEVSLYTPNILVANGKYYLYYQKTTKDLKSSISLSWADSPDGPWQKNSTSVIQPGKNDDFDEFNIGDPTFIVKGGKYYMYYRGQTTSKVFPHGESVKKGSRFAWGVAIADKPEGPFKKSKLNPLFCGGDEGVILFPYRNGVCAIIGQGPERGSVQFSEDALNFYPKCHGIRDHYYGGPDRFPVAANVFRTDNFCDIEKEKGYGIIWGLHNKLRFENGQELKSLYKWECDLTLERGDSLRLANEEWFKKYHQK